MEHKDFKFFKKSTSVIQIHGELNNTKNPIIFGFGDELDGNYKKIEEDRTKGFFTHIKSFWYFKTLNYANLVRFVDSSPYEVIVLGHSCGLPDRTMLHMIFENDNCANIKIYYHERLDGNNFTDTTEEISRHFDNKDKMRRRLVSFDKCEPMPQASL